MRLHLKIALVVILTIFSPYLLGLFIPLSPMLYLLAAFFCAVIAIALLFLFLKPSAALVKSTQIFADGNLNHRIDLRSGDEFEEVGNSFNLMADKLSKTFQKIENDRIIAIAEKDKLDEVLSSVIDGIIALDFNKNVILLNKAAQELTGYTTTEIQTKPIDQYIRLFSDKDEIVSKTYCQGNYNQSAKLIGKNGKQTKVNLVTAQVAGTVQTNLNCILILHDLSREEELEQMKLDFVSMASHELKTPLTSIIGYLSVFLDESKDKLPKESLSLLDKSFAAAQQLQTLITNLLNVNKIEKEQLSVSPEPTEYLPIVTKAIDDLRSQATQKNIVVTLNPPSQSLPKVLADPMRLSEVVVNLLSNALNYTNPSGKVEIFIKASPTEVETVISDNGVGIPQEAIPHLFNKFFRVSNQLQKSNKGTGLGLYITKSIIEKLHGKIWVQSQTGKGSNFFFTLPIVTYNSSILDRNKFVSQAIQSGALNY